MQTSDPRQEHRSQLRKDLRARRQALTPSQQAQASQALLRQLMAMPLFRRSNHIALYWAVDGEIDLFAIANQLWKIGKHCYLPVLHPSQARQLWFVEYHSNSLLRPNRFGIPEPDPLQAHKIPAHLLDIVLLPLVGFDLSGARLGMGGGFYDTTFAYKQQKPRAKPHLLGVAHACQQMERLEVESWDISLEGIVTDQAVQWAKSANESTAAE